MIEQWIRKAYESRVEAWAKTHDLPVEFENTEFTPPREGYYLRTNLLMAPAVESDIISEEQHGGIFQVSVFGPARVGTGMFFEIVGGLRDLFPLDLTLAAGQSKVMQRSPLRTGPGIQETDLYMVPASFEFVTFV